MYAEMFKQMQPAYEPRLIEAFVRLQYSTLDHLSRDTLRDEAAIAAACIDEMGAEAADSFAKSMGL